MNTLTDTKKTIYGGALFEGCAAVMSKGGSYGKYQD